MSLQKFNIQDYDFLYTSDSAERLIGIDVFNSMFLPDSYFFYEGIKIYRKSSDSKIALFSGFFGDYPYVYFSYFPIQSCYFYSSVIGDVYIEHVVTLDNNYTFYKSSFLLSFKYYLYSGAYGGSLVASFDTFEDAFNYCCINILTLRTPYIVRCIPEPSHPLKTERFVLRLLVSPQFCCYPYFTPIVRTLGGSAVTDQFQNLKIICQLLGVDTNTTLSDCDAIKEYLQRLVQFFGLSAQNEPNENLKLICYFLGVDINENGLKDCALSKDYVKRISTMLGG